MRTRSAPLLLAAFLVAPISAFGQGFSGPATITQPTTANHCVKIGPNGGNNIVDAGSACGTGAGTVTAVTGTANQINVATGTTTPALTLSSTIVTPGSLAVGAGSAITSSGPGGALASGAFASAYTLPVAAAATIGGVFSKAAVSHNFLTSISSSTGAIGQAQPACADVSDAGTGCSTTVGTAATANTGTSGATVPLLNGTNTWSGAQTLSSSALSFTGAISGSGIFGTSGIKIKTTSGALSDTTSSGTVATNYNSLFGGNTQTATSATTITNNYGSYFVAATCSTNVTCTNNYALGADTLGVVGASNFNGTVTIGGTAAINQTSTTSSNFGGSITVGGATNGSVYLNRAGGFGTMEVRSVDGYSWSSSSSNQTATPDLNFCRFSSTTVEIGSGACGANGSMLLTNITGSGAAIIFSGLTTGTNADTVCYKSDGTLLIQAAACTISSRRFKTEIKPYRLSLSDAIYRMPVVTFRLKDQARNPDPNSRATQLGLIAEDIAKIFPLCALYEPDMKTPKSYRQECLIAALVKAAQEQHQVNEGLARRVAILEHKH